jgi:hypothetical protein
VRTLSSQELIELLPAEAGLVDVALRRFEFMAPALCREAGHCRHLIDEGFIEPAAIRWRDRNAFFFGWRMTTDRGLWIDLAQTLNAGASTDVLVAGVSLLAQREQARYIRFLTARPGLVRIAEREGYRAEAVVMVKPL